MLHIFVNHCYVLMDLVAGQQSQGGQASSLAEIPADFGQMPEVEVEHQLRTSHSLRSY